MAVAFLSARRSKDPNKQACLLACLPADLLAACWHQHMTVTGHAGRRLHSQPRQDNPWHWVQRLPAWVLRRQGANVWLLCVNQTLVVSQELSAVRQELL